MTLWRSRFKVDKLPSMVVETYRNLDLIIVSQKFSQLKVNRMMFYPTRKCSKLLQTSFASNCRCS